MGTEYTQGGPWVLGTHRVGHGYLGYGGWVMGTEYIAVGHGY